jgi:membrane protein
LAQARGRYDAVQRRVRRTLPGGIWERMLETEFVDRSVALAGKAFVSFFPLAIVVAAFMPAGVRTSIFATITSRLGLRGEALALSKEAFVSADDLRRATGVLGLILTFFFASSFTTALQRIYLRAWRRPRNLKVGSYTRGLIWLAALLVYMTATGTLARALGNGLGVGLFIVLVLPLTVGWWWFSAWYLLLGHVRWRVLLPTALITTVALLAYGASASVWMPNMLTGNVKQFGFFGISLALVSWFSGASICLIVGACAGPVLAEDEGAIGRRVRGRDDDLLVAGAPPSYGPPADAPKFRDAFTPASDDPEGLS